MLMQHSTLTRLEMMRTVLAQIVLHCNRHHFRYYALRRRYLCDDLRRSNRLF